MSQASYSGCFFHACSASLNSLVLFKLGIAFERCAMARPVNAPTCTMEFLGVSEEEKIDSGIAVIVSDSRDLGRTFLADLDGPGQVRDSEF